MKKLLLATTVALWASSPANAIEVTVDAVSGTWSNVQGGLNVIGVSTSQINWGTGGAQGQSGYLFQGIAPPAQGPFALGTDFNLGTFTHINKPIDIGSSITGATLDLNITFSSDLFTGTRTLTEQYVFAHNETPNVCDPQPTCANDIVTAVTNLGGSSTFSSGGVDYFFNFTAFQQNGIDVTQFSSPENGSNQAFLRGEFVAAPVPGPIVGAGIPSLMAALSFFGLNRLRRRKQLQSRRR